MFDRNAVLELPLDLIDEPAYDLRLVHDVDRLTELAEDIGHRGLLQPIGVSPVADSDRYIRRWGGRRLAAHRLLGRPTIRALVVPEHFDETETQLAENLFRADLSPIEEALAVKAALGQGKTREELRLRLRKSMSWMEARLDLLDLPADVQHHVHIGELPLGVAQALGRVDNDQYRAHLVGSAISGGCSVMLARAWLADYEAHRPRIIANSAMVDQLLARPLRTTVLIHCDGCDDPVDVDKLTTYRVCPACRVRVEAAQAT